MMASTYLGETARAIYQYSVAHMILTGVGRACLS
jgi:hypothetical protein